jgi:hypothetical protein
VGIDGEATFVSLAIESERDIDCRLFGVFEVNRNETEGEFRSLDRRRSFESIDLDESWIDNRSFDSTFAGTDVTSGCGREDQKNHDILAAKAENGTTS